MDFMYEVLVMELDRKVVRKKMGRINGKSFSKGIVGNRTSKF